MFLERDSTDLPAGSLWVTWSVGPPLQTGSGLATGWLGDSYSRVLMKYMCGKKNEGKKKDLDLDLFIIYWKRYVLCMCFLFERLTPRGVDLLLLLLYRASKDEAPDVYRLAPLPTERSVN